MAHEGLLSCGLVSCGAELKKDEWNVLVELIRAGTLTRL
jgi:hypothetical protein